MAIGEYAVVVAEYRLTMDDDVLCRKSRNAVLKERQTRPIRMFINASWAGQKITPEVSIVGGKC